MNVTNVDEKLIEATDNLQIKDDAVNEVDNGQLKKKKKNRKKKKDGEGASEINFQENGEIIANGNSTEKEENGVNKSEEPAAVAKKKKNKKKKTGEVATTSKVQTDPPSVPVSELFPDGNFPIGQIMDHPISNDDSKEKRNNI